MKIGYITTKGLNSFADIENKPVAPGTYVGEDTHSGLFVSVVRIDRSWVEINSKQLLNLEKWAESLGMYGFAALIEGGKK
jgi:hypothetical protein